MGNAATGRMKDPSTGERRAYVVRDDEGADANDSPK